MDEIHFLLQYEKQLLIIRAAAAWNCEYVSASPPRWHGREEGKKSKYSWWGRKVPDKRLTAAPRRAGESFQLFPRWINVLQLVQTLDCWSSECDESFQQWCWWNNGGQQRDGRRETRTIKDREGVLSSVRTWWSFSGLMWTEVGWGSGAGEEDGGEEDGGEEDGGEEDEEESR